MSWSYVRNALKILAHFLHNFSAFSAFFTKMRWNGADTSRPGMDCFTFYKTTQIDSKTNLNLLLPAIMKMVLEKKCSWGESGGWGFIFKTKSYLPFRLLAGSSSWSCKPPDSLLSSQTGTTLAETWAGLEPEPENRQLTDTSWT